MSHISVRNQGASSCYMQQKKQVARSYEVQLQITCCVHTFIENVNYKQHTLLRKCFFIHSQRYRCLHAKVFKQTPLSQQCFELTIKVQRHVILHQDNNIHKHVLLCLSRDVTIIIKKEYYLCLYSYLQSYFPVYLSQSSKKCLCGDIFFTVVILPQKLPKQHEQPTLMEISLLICRRIFVTIFQ